MSAIKTTGLLFGAIVVTGGAYVGYTRYQQSRVPDSPVAAETPEERAQNIQAAFTSTAEVDDAEVETFVARLQATVVEGDGTAIRPMVDPGRMVDAVEATLGKDMPDLLRSTLESQLYTQVIDFFDPTVVETTIKRIHRDDEGNIVVYLRQVDGDRIMMKSRWWLYHDGDRLRWWDAEDLQLGLRVSTLMAAGAGSALGGGDTTKLETFVETIGALADADFTDATAARALAARFDALDTSGLPTDFRRLAIISRASLSMVLGETKDAVERLEALDGQSLQPLELPMRHYQLAACYIDLERWDDAAAAAQRYLELLGDDAEAYTLLGAAEAGRDHPEAALEAYDKGIADDPLLSDNYLGAALVLTEVEPLTERLRRAPETQVLDAVARELIDLEEPDALGRVLEAGKIAAPEWDQERWASQLAEP